VSEFSWRQEVSWKLQRAVVPDLESSQIPFFDAVDRAIRTGLVWLDLGCGRDLIPKWFNPKHYARLSESIKQARTIVGLDFDLPSLKDNPLVHKVRGDVVALPFAPESFDLVTANMVVEHLSDPVAWLGEVRRILKPSGVFIFHTPNILSPLVAAGSVIPGWVRKPLIRLLEGRAEEDVFPTRYRLNTASQIRRGARRAGFAIEELHNVCTSPVSQALGPLVIPELLTIRLIRTVRPFAFLRPDIVAVLRRI
jgi:SAM-dependent methyltransferase